MDKKDYFYYGKLYGIPIYYQPEEKEVVPRNKLCEMLFHLYAIIILPLTSRIEVKIKKKTITREELKKRGLVE